MNYTYFMQKNEKKLAVYVKIGYNRTSESRKGDRNNEKDFHRW